MEHNVFILLMCILESGILPVNEVKGEQSEFSRMETTSFEDLVKSKTFVDKTLLIKDIFNSPHHVNLILAPRKFGKTSNINMIEIFSGIDVDENGIPHDKMSTKRFKFFKENNFKIFGEDAYMKEHFSAYPIVHIDYSPLHGLDSYKDLVEKLIIVISESYSRHEYLLKNDSLWSGFDKGLFQSYMSARENHKEHNLHILTSLQWLCELLQKHFGKKPLVLIDEYDAYVYGAMFKDSRDIHKITQLMTEVDGNLLKSQSYVSKVILTGILEVFRGDMKKGIWTSHFLEDHPFSQYHGLTRQDLDHIFSKLAISDDEKAELKESIVGYYGSYKLYHEDNSFTEIYSIWPVVNFIVSKQHVTDYLARSEYLISFKLMTRPQKVKEQLHSLILGESVIVDRNIPFHEEDIHTLNNMVKYRNCTSHGVEVFLRLIYSFGYLTPIKENKGLLLEEFKLPNNETCDELLRYTPC